MQKIREKALAEENWCAVKHLLCCEEHIIETIQKLQRIWHDSNDDKILKMIIELNKIGDSVRLLRQRLVDLAFEFEELARGEEKSGENFEENLEGNIEGDFEEVIVDGEDF